jgi:hypothetical protein
MHDGFLPSFPLEKMSAEALEAAALAPYRFTSALAKYQQPAEGHLTEISALYPVRETTLDLTPLGLPPHELLIPYLIPGGRYLLLVTGEGREVGYSMHLVERHRDLPPTVLCSVECVGMRKFNYISTYGARIRILTSVYIQSSLYVCLEFLCNEVLNFYTQVNATSAFMKSIQHLRAPLLTRSQYFQ